MKFKKANYKALHLGQDNAQFNRLMDGRIWQLCREGLGEEKFIMSWQRAPAAQKANHVLGCLRSTMARRVREGMLPLDLW